MKVTKELVQEKLLEWTASSKVQEVLGLSSMDEALFKKELQTLEDKGLIERDGIRRGLKFKAVIAGEPKKIPKVDDASNFLAAMTGKSSTVAAEPKPKSKKAEKTVDLSEIPCEVTHIPKHEHIHEVTHVGINSLLAFLIKGPGDGDRSISLKKCPKGIVVKTYNNIYLLSEVIYTKENFSKLLKASGITLE